MWHVSIQVSFQKSLWHPPIHLSLPPSICPFLPHSIPLFLHHLTIPLSIIHLSLPPPSSICPSFPPSPICLSLHSSSICLSLPPSSRQHNPKRFPVPQSAVMIISIQTSVPSLQTHCTVSQPQHYASCLALSWLSIGCRLQAVGCLFPWAPDILKLFEDN